MYVKYKIYNFYFQRKYREVVTTHCSLWVEAQICTFKLSLPINNKSMNYPQSWSTTFMKLP